MKFKENHKDTEFIRCHPAGHSVCEKALLVYARKTDIIENNFFSRIQKVDKHKVDRDYGFVNNQWVAVMGPSDCQLPLNATRRRRGRGGRQGSCQVRNFSADLGYSNYSVYKLIKYCE